jgi:hypothetical protein
MNTLSHYIQELDKEIRSFACSCSSDDCSCQAFNLSNRLINGQVNVEQAEYELGYLQQRTVYFA